MSAAMLRSCAHRYATPIAHVTRAQATILPNNLVPAPRAGCGNQLKLKVQTPVTYLVLALKKISMIWPHQLKGTVYTLSLDSMLSQYVGVVADGVVGLDQRDTGRILHPEVEQLIVEGLRVRMIRVNGLQGEHRRVELLIAVTHGHCPSGRPRRQARHCRR